MSSGAEREATEDPCGAPAPRYELRRRIFSVRATGKAWKAIAAGLEIAESNAIYHANRAAEPPMPRYRPVAPPRP